MLGNGAGGWDFRGLTKLRAALVPGEPLVPVLNWEE